MADSKPLKYIDPHIHMVSRTTADYQAMSEAGIVAVIEPSFWVGQPRTQAGTFLDYFASLIGWERFRASQFGIRHYCTIGLNSKEANNEALAEQVMDLIPRFAGKEGVVAIGEIGYDEMTPAEDKYFRLQLEMAVNLDLPVMIHTPHRNKKEGTSRSMALIVKKYGPERILVDSSADWGVSDPLAVPKTAGLMLDMGIPRQAVEETCYLNALRAYGQSGQIRESDWADTVTPGDLSGSFQGNSVARGQPLG